ncbi:hypothetical protein [Cellulosimicrobium sp. Marseille-Q4280]|uniref:hypothetical protein n=1 Tax=Cellulosimicrobium sp. Marseille-Q4280 TaxID=2937992 RepID=UPI00203EF070|nr:hypothetical protein [Cellulosimicrobium sp. Marseille-Q4280]
MVLDDGDTLARALPRSGLPMLGRTDPYGDVTLSRTEMGQLVSELRTLAGRAARGDVAVLVQVLDLAVRCRDAPGTELRFEGD